MQHFFMQTSPEHVTFRPANTPASRPGLFDSSTHDKTLCANSWSDRVQSRKTVSTLGLLNTKFPRIPRWSLYKIEHVRFGLHDRKTGH
jgi:hypothetical protein